MSAKKPQKRLVGWKQYIGDIAARVLGRSVAGGLLGRTAESDDRKTGFITERDGDYFH
jgi:hypothetical protein